ncbi:MAG TPA: hypothetical protein VFQ91_09020 [Bryobacteraceae bacterium]|nr:hypothetical protein [Bryobacteraceae bacterium]
MIGILVHGNNHWIVAGPCPSESEARELVRRWSLIQIGGSLAVDGWSMQTRAFREDLQWAVEIAIPQPRSNAVETLLAEMAARGVSLQTW